MIFNKAKSCLRRTFNLCGLDVKKIRFKPYQWLQDKNINTILDIGANTGQFAKQFNKLLPDAKIYSFEPLEICYNKLMENMGDVSQFQAFNIALGDINGETNIYKNDYTPSSSLLPIGQIHKEAFPFTKNVTAETIKIRRLDDALGELDITDNILVKIDVQGTEDKVILGGEVFLRKASIIILETSFQALYEGQILFDGIYDLLREKGFAYAGSEHTLRNPQNGSILQNDSIFIKDLSK